MRCLPTVKTFTVNKANTSICNDQKRRELQIATHVACHKSINAVDELSDILEDEIGAFKMYRTKCSAVMRSVLAPYFRDKLRDDIGNTPYSLYLDETTDISVSKLLCICIKYCSKKHNHFVSAYLGLVELLDADANGIVNAIIDFLQANVLDSKYGWHMYVASHSMVH